MAQKKEECCTWSKYMIHLKEIIYVTPNTEYYKNLPIKGKVQNKNLNAGKTLPFSMFCALFLRSSKSTAAARILSSSHAYWCHVIINALCTAEWGWKWKVFEKQVFYLLRAAHRSPHQSHICRRHLIGNMESRTLDLENSGKWDSMQILISN